LLDRLYASPLTAHWAARLLYRSVTEVLHNGRHRAERVPGVPTLLALGGQLATTVAPDAGRTVDLRLREYAERGVRFVLGHGPTTGDPTDQTPWFDAVMDLWDDHAGDPVSALRQYVSRDDLEDIVVFVFEFWRSFRDTDYFRSLLDAGIDVFFDKYGDVTVRELLEEVGIGREDMVEEALRFGPPVIEVLRRHGMLAELVRRRLEPFFFSEQVRAILA